MRGGQCWRQRRSITAPWRSLHSGTRDAFHSAARERPFDMGILTLLAITLSTASAPRDEQCAALPHQRIVIVGNLVLDDAVYEALVDRNETDAEVMRTEIE